MEIYKIGSKGEGVKRIQKALHVIADGIFGDCTREAVICFQKAHGLKPDGVVGTATLAFLFPSIIKKSRRKITDIVVHCTASREGQIMTVEQIRSIHKTNGWSDIGYHYVIYLDGTIHNGRDVDIAGAHVAGYNAHSIGVVYVGGLENRKGVPVNKLKSIDTRTPEQKKALRELLTELRKLYPNAKIRGHRDFSPDLNHNGIIEPKEWIKDCPCFNAMTEYKDI